MDDNPRPLKATYTLKLKIISKEDEALNLPFQNLADSETKKSWQRFNKGIVKKP